MGFMYEPTVFGCVQDKSKTAIISITLMSTNETAMKGFIVKLTHEHLPSYTSAVPISFAVHLGIIHLIALVLRLVT